MLQKAGNPINGLFWSPFSGLFQNLANGFEPLLIKHEQKSCFEALLGNTTKKPTLVRGSPFIDKMKLFAYYQYSAELPTWQSTNRHLTFDIACC